MRRRDRASWSPEAFTQLYRGAKRSHDFVEDAETQQERRLSVDEYKHFVRGVFRILFNIPIGPTSTRYYYKHSLHYPHNPCTYADIRLVIDVRPTAAATMEVTFFKFSEATRNVAEQIAHTQLTAASCMSTIEGLLRSVFG